MNEKLKENLQPQNEVEIRLERLNVAIEEIINQLYDDERAKVKAIILYGGLAREHTEKSSDIDIHVDMEPYDLDIFKKIIDILKDKFTDIEFSFSSKNIIKGGRMAKLITSQKYPKQLPKWKFLYSRSEQEKLELNKILSETRKQKQASNH